MYDSDFRSGECLNVTIILFVPFSTDKYTVDCRVLHESKYRVVFSDYFFFSEYRLATTEVPTKNLDSRFISLVSTI